MTLNDFQSNNYRIASFALRESKLEPLFYVLYTNNLFDNYKFTNIKMRVHRPSYCIDLYTKINCEDDRKQLQLIRTRPE